MMESSSSSKMVKALGCAAQVSCLVDGCNSNLSQSRDYHRRHKVCELHSKTSKVTVKGQEQRFCQQCSRFHSLIEFDNEKRSCRKRLDGHNRRRRKPQPELLYRTFTNVCSDQPGSTLLSFSNPPIQPTAVGSSAWINDVKTEDDTSLSYSTCNYINKHNLYHEYATQNYKAGLESVQCTSNLHPETYMFCHQLLEPNSAHGITLQKEYLDSLHRAENPSGARPLLSAEPIGTGSSQMVHSDPGHYPLSQSFLQNMHFSGVDQFTQTRPLVSDDDVATLHFEEVCEHENRDCSSESGFQHNLSFRLDS